MTFLEFTDTSAFDENLTPNRISTYRSLLGLKKNDVDDKTVIGLYVSIQSLLSYLYPPFHFFEVTFRNRLNYQLSDSFKTIVWYKETPLSHETFEIIDDKFNRLAENIVKNSNNTILIEDAMDLVNHDNLVCDLSLGQWVHLLSKKNRQGSKMSSFWGARKNKVFLGIKRNESISDIFLLFEDILSYRNRFFHHEPIWKNESMTEDFFQKSISEKFDIVCQEILKIYDLIILGIYKCSPVLSNSVKMYYRKNLLSEIKKQQEDLSTYLSKTGIK